MTLSLPANALARCLASAGYTRQGVRSFLGEVAWHALDRMAAGPALAVCAAQPEHPIAGLFERFWLGQHVDTDRLTKALGADGVGALAALSLRENTVIRCVELVSGETEHEFLIASDPDELCGVAPLPSDHVLGVGGSTRTLIALLPPEADRAMDLGCGSGAVALHLSTIARHVVATDLSQRALEFTKLNAALNGVDNIEVRHGSLFDPVADERFDLIASNPPFVITPRSEAGASFEYRDGGLGGDKLMREVLAGLPGHLTDEGTARLLGNWEGPTEHLLHDAKPLRGVVIERERLDPAQYAELWIRDSGIGINTVEGRRLEDAWLSDFASRGTASIGMGWLILARGGTGIETWTASQPVDYRTLSVYAHWFLGMQGLLDQEGDDWLLQQRLIVAGDVIESRHGTPGAAGPTVIELRQRSGLQRTIAVDSALAACVGACDGELELGQIIVAVAALLEVDQAALIEQMRPQVRELILAGMLAPQ